MRRIYWWRGFKVGDYMLGYYGCYVNSILINYRKTIFKLTKVNRSRYNGIIIYDEKDKQDEGKLNSFDPTWCFRDIKYYKLNPEEVMLEKL